MPEAQPSAVSVAMAAPAASPSSMLDGMAQEASSAGMGASAFATLDAPMPQPDGPGDGPDSFASDPEAEDPEDPEAAMLVPPPPPDKDEESLAVPVQASPSLLPDLWPSLVGEFMGIKPLQGFHLGRTRLEWESGEAPGLRVVFLAKSAFNVIDGDADFRKTIQAFLASKVADGREYPVRFSLDAEAAASEAAGEDRSTPMGLDDPGRREPIINYIRDVFDGRLVG